MGPEAAVAAPAVAGAGMTASELALADIALGGLGGSAGAASLLPAAGGIGAGTALQALSTGVNFAAQQDAEKRRKSLANAMTAYGTDKARKGQAITEEFIAGDEPVAREAQRQAAQSKAADEYQTTVGAAQAFEAKDDAAGKTSGRYTKAKAGALDRQADRNARLIEQLSTIRAVPRAGEQRTRRYSVAAGDLAGEMGASRNVSRAYMTDIGNVETNPYAKLGADALMGTGMGIAEQERRRRIRSALTT